MKRVISVTITDEQGSIHYGKTVSAEIDLDGETNQFVARGDGQQAAHEDPIVAALLLASPVAEDAPIIPVPLPLEPVLFPVESQPVAPVYKSGAVGTQRELF